MPYGPAIAVDTPKDFAGFQSLIWVACPTGGVGSGGAAPDIQFQSLIWVACPTGIWQRQPAWLGTLFQSLIWVACPTGGRLHWASLLKNRRVSIPHMGCMPYGQRHLGGDIGHVDSFNPSYGLHALRATVDAAKVAKHNGFNPSYGLHALRAAKNAWYFFALALFQSLIWVACPTGQNFANNHFQKVWVSIPHMGCMPYGQKLCDS